MSLSRLLIKDFRNIAHADLALAPGFNFLVGANGSGKTSVLEAISTLGHGRAFRSLKIGRVIRHEQQAFVLHGRLQGDERETAIGLSKDKHGDSKVLIEGNALKCENVRILLTDSVSSVQIEDAASQSAAYVVMPMRL